MSASNDWGNRMLKKVYTLEDALGDAAAAARAHYEELYRQIASFPDYQFKVKNLLVPLVGDIDRESHLLKKSDGTSYMKHSLTKEELQDWLGDMIARENALPEGAVFGPEWCARVIAQQYVSAAEHNLSLVGTEVERPAHSWHSR